MTIQAPFKRTVRPFRNGQYSPKSGQMSFVRTSSFSSDPRPYIRGFLILQRDIRSLFEFIHPADVNLGTYSEHIGILLVRTCFEVETNLKAILKENGYLSTSNWTMSDYRKVESSHRLSEYEVLLPEWSGAGNTIVPFQIWRTSGKLDWYQAYNKYKHDRVANLHEATFGQLINAWSGLFALISAQYFLDDFSVEKKPIGFAHTLSAGEFWHGVGGYLKVKFPVSWPDAEKYDFTLVPGSFQDSSFAANFPY
ncbi:MAG: hypothetical protein ACRCU5_02595 [Rhizobiaceae bacterium]